ncbi:hypothetical protein D9M69_648880 [compost metagenome]
MSRSSPSAWPRSTTSCVPSSAAWRWWAEAWKKVQDAYKKACDQLVHGKDNLVKQVSDFRQLGVAVKGEITEKWVDRADLELNLLEHEPKPEEA